MTEHPQTDRDVNPYAAPVAPPAAVDSQWPGGVDLIYAASIFVLWYAAMCALRWLTDHDAFYVFLLGAGGVSMTLVTKRYVEYNGRLPSPFFKAVVACEMAGLFCVPTYQLSQIWSVTGYPLAETVAGTAIAWVVTFFARAMRE